MERVTTGFEEKDLVSEFCKPGCKDATPCTRAYNHVFIVRTGHQLRLEGFEEFNKGLLIVIGKGFFPFRGREIVRTKVMASVNDKVWVFT